MGRACSMVAGEVHTGFCWGKPERDHLQDLHTDGRIKLKYILNTYNLNTYILNTYNLNTYNSHKNL
jgi:hypothetical protein